MDDAGYKADDKTEVQGVEGKTMIGHNSQMLPQDVETATEFFRTFGERFKPAERLATVLEAKQKITLSKLTLAANAKSFNEREAIARTQAEYLQAVEDYAEAQSEATTLKLEKSCHEMIIEIWRTQSANARGK